jgi:hypothetical protein
MPDPGDSAYRAKGIGVGRVQPSMKQAPLPPYYWEIKTILQSLCSRLQWHHKVYRLPQKPVRPDAGPFLRKSHDYY